MIVVFSSGATADLAERVRLHYSSRGKHDNIVLFHMMNCRLSGTLGTVAIWLLEEFWLLAVVESYGRSSPGGSAILVLSRVLPILA